MTDIARLRELVKTVREVAAYLPGSFERVTAMKVGASELETAIAELETLRAREGEMRKGLEAVDVWFGDAVGTMIMNDNGWDEAAVLIESIRVLLTPASPGEDGTAPGVKTDG